MRRRRQDETVKKLGAPTVGEDREDLFVVTFRADQEVLEALDKLTEASAGPGVQRPRSVALRRAVLDAARRLEIETQEQRAKDLRLPRPPK